VSYRLIANREEWNDALLALPARHVLQSWDWGEVKTRHGWLPARLLWARQGQPFAAAQVLRRPVPRTPWSVMYVPKGPALEYGDMETLAQVLGDLEGYARAQRSIFVKIDPDVELPQVGAAHPVADVLSTRGWLYSAQQIQFRNTALLDLALSEEDLLAAMKSKTRYNTRLAGRRGVAVRPGTTQDIPRFYEMYDETGTRDGFLIRPFEYYQDTWQTFLERGLAHMLLAEVVEGADASAAGEGTPSGGKRVTVAGLILFLFGDKAWYMYGASTAEHRDRMPNYALQWEAIRWAKSAGCTVYDLWGAPERLEESDSLWGVWRFKEGLGARFTPHIGAHDYPTLPLLYWMYEVALPRYLGWLRRRR
jgi:peptidoglycan pentaglycine glycine transferase (the first glycine)